jgi:site-specific recombinase XerD
MKKEKSSKLKNQYIHGLGRAIRSFSTWEYEEGYLDENVMRRLKLPQLPKTFPEPLREDEIQRIFCSNLSWAE